MGTRTFLQPEMTVEDLLRTWPNVYGVFLNGKAECIGCFMQKFCTLREVAGVYEVSPEEFMNELEKHVRSIDLPKRS